MGNSRFQPKSKKKVAVTRKQIRKEKRQQKKISRSSYYQKSKEFHQKIKKVKKNDPQPVKVQEESDEDIPSDFESDTELESAPPKVSQIEKDRMAEMAEREEYENELKRKRIDQLIEQNAEEDKVIRKYEKLLKINKKKGKKELAFDDGLDYALELCTPESIQKMYAAAKDAAADDEESGDDFREDFELATGKKSSKENVTSSNKKHSLMANEMKKAKDKKHIHKLKAIEQKYFGDDINLDDCDSLAGSDSELDEGQSASEDELNSATSVEDSDSDDEDIVEEPMRKASNKNKTITFQVVKEPPAKKKKIIESGVDNTEGSESSSDSSAHADSLESGNDFQESDDENIDCGPTEDSDSDPDAKSVWEQLKNRKGKGTIKNTADTLEPQIDEDSDPESNSVWAQLKNRKRNKTTESKSNSWEDIYGRKRDKDGNVLEENTTGKYMPPHIRARLEAEKPNDPKRQEKLIRLKKQLKGQLNRLSETNLLRIAKEIDALYMNNARFDMNNTLTTLILEAVVAPTLSPDRMVLEHTLLVALLHANVGSEVGAHFLQVLVEKFNEMSKEIAHQNVENKELENIVLILCHLYTFQVFHHSLIYEILNRLSNEWSEKSVECILLALRAIGFILRKDNALNLKEFILKIQQSATKAPEELKIDCRVKFMLETLMAIKNNNMTKIPQFDPSLVEHFRKLLKGMIVNGKYVTTLNITMDDLLNADQRGKWWLVGSAWTGNEQKQDKNVEKSNSTTSEFSQKLLDLARKQRMNTDDRRSVFCIIMSAEDYIDAFEKIVQLSIKDHRTIVTVIIHCCLSEKVFNPYYAVLSQKFCDHDRKYVLAVQYALWDRLRDLHSLTKLQVNNLAQYLIYLIGHGGQPLSVLKVIEFGELDKVTLRLVRQIMLGLLLGQEAICEQVFERIAPSFKLNMFKDSVRLFLNHFLLKGTKQGSISDEQMKLLKRRVQIADKSLATSESRIKF